MSLHFSPERKLRFDQARLHATYTEDGVHVWLDDGRTLVDDEAQGQQVSVALDVPSGVKAYALITVRVPLEADSDS